jgi:uncharacterized protein (DUF2236 family)
MTATVLTPLDPDGLVWEHIGRDPMYRLSNGLRETMLQNMHPGLGAGVEHHSVFFEDPLARGQRTIGPIMSVVCGGPTAPRDEDQMSGKDLVPVRVRCDEPD